MAKNHVEFSTVDQHFRCLVHVLNLALQGILKLINLHWFVELLIDQGNEIEDADNGEDRCEDTDEFKNTIIRICQTCKKVRRWEVLTNKL